MFPNVPNNSYMQNKYPAHQAGYFGMDRVSAGRSPALSYPSAAQDGHGGPWAAAAVSSRAAYTARGAASPVLTGWEAAHGNSQLADGALVARLVHGLGIHLGGGGGKGTGVQDPLRAVIAVVQGHMLLGGGQRHLAVARPGQ